MADRFSLYVTLWRIALQDALQYRAEAAIWSLYDILPPIMMIFLWLAAYQEQATVAGYDLSAMLLYTVGVMLMRSVVTTHPEWDVDRGIRQGELSLHLVRPINPWAFWFVEGIAWRFMRSLLVMPVLLVCLIWLVPHVRSVAIAWERLPALGLSLVLAFVLCFLAKLCIGFFGFWLTDIIGVLTLYEVTVYVFGGVLLPLELLPPVGQTIAAVLPFQYIYYVPLAVALGRVDGLALWSALASQLGWVLGMALLAYALWRSGLRRYEAVGG